MACRLRRTVPLCLTSEQDHEQGQTAWSAGGARSCGYERCRMSLGKSMVGPTVKNAPTVAMPTTVPIVKS